MDAIAVDDKIVGDSGHVGVDEGWQVHALLFDDVLAKTLDYVYANLMEPDNLRVINISLGGTEPSSAEQTALQYAQSRNVLPVCAAGNEAAAVSYPAAFPECMAVSATDWYDTRASYSNAGPEVEVSAPGGDTIEATAYDMIASTWNNGGYNTISGTSMATPHVSGVAAIIRARYPSAPASQIVAKLDGAVDDLGPAGRDSSFGFGRVDLVQAATE